MNDTKVVPRIAYDFPPQEMVITHADYRALEERYETLWEVQALTTQKLNEAQQELASLRARVGYVSP